MLRLIEGSLFSEAQAIVRDGIKKNIESGKRTLMIVPEQQTVIAEKEMAELLMDSAPLLFEVTNFTRLANTVFRSLGGVDKEYCDSVKGSLIMWRALCELAPTLNVTNGHSEVNYGMVKRALATTKETDSLSLSADDIGLAIDSIEGSARLKGKLSDLVKIKSLYKKLLSEKYADSGEDIAAATEALRANDDMLADTEIFIEGFTSFTEPQYRLIELLMLRTEVSVLLDLPKSMRASFEYSEIVASEKRLIASANKMGLSPTLVRPDTIVRGRESLYEISRLLWKNHTDFDNITLQNPEELRIFEAITPYEECDFVASDIKQRVMEGASYSDFAVIAGDISRYAGILDVSARRAGVPLFISKSRDVSSFEAIKLIYTALASATGGFMREDVISYAKCGLSTVTREECDALEIYTERWQISGSRFTDGVIWNMNPDGYSTFRTEKTDKALLELNEIREKLISPLTALEASLFGAETVNDYLMALYEFITSIKLYERLDERIYELYALGEPELARENERIYKIICDSLDTLSEVSGEVKTNAEGFISQLKIAFSAASVSKIPSFSDSVTAGSVNMLRLTPKKHIYLIGVNRGELPTPIDSDSYFTERDKEELMKAGLPFEPELLIKEAKALYSFTRAFSYASETVTLIYANKNIDYSASKRSEVIDRILKISGIGAPTRISEMPTNKMIFTPAQALSSLGRLNETEYGAVRSALEGAGYSDGISLAEKRVENDSLTLSGKTLKQIYEGDIELSQSKIDSYNTCPLAYFCRYNLGLSEEEPAAFDARNIGSFIHAILENFFALCQKLDKSLDELTDSDKEGLIESAAKIYLDKIMSEGDGTGLRTALLIKRLIRAAKPIVDGLCEEFLGCQYMPRYFELRIGGSGELCPELLAIEDTDKTRTLIKGSIDRVDAFKYGDDVYVRVVDYKTGQKSFKPEELASGKNLQMFLYLSAVIDTKNKRLLRDLGVGDGGRLIPAGVIYVKSDLSDVKISHDSPDDEEKALKSDQKRQGMLLNDSVSIAAMNARYLPISINKDGGFSKGSEDLLYTDEGWLTLRKTVEDAVKRVTGKMRSGNIFAEPMLDDKSSPCGYCKFKPMCRNAKIK